MRRYGSVLFTALAILLFPAAAPAAEKPVKIGFIYISPANEGGWSYSHDAARQELAKQPGVTTVYTESVPEGRESEQAIRKMAESGCNIIFTTSFGYLDPTLKVAGDFPNITFLHCSGFKTTPNVSTYFGKIYQARFLTGMVAGAMTKKNLIGYAAAFPIPEVLRGINAFTLGARSVNPEARVHVIWTKTWYDEAKERETALALADKGVDVIAQHQDSTAAQQVAEERGIYSVGYQADMSASAPKAHLVSAIWNWTPFYLEVLDKVRKGEWHSANHWLDLKSGIVDISAFGPMVPQTVQNNVLKRKDEIIRGDYTVFTGPVADQNGRIRIKENEKPDDATLLNMNWLVTGVVGESL